MYRLQSFLTLLGLLSLLSFAQVALADTPEQTASDSTERLAIAVERLVQQLEQESATQNEDKQLRKLDIAISYLNFRSRRIEILDRDLTMTKSERERYEDVLQQFQERRELLKTALEEKSPEEKKELEQNLEELELREKNLELRRSRIEEDIIIMENKIVDLQNQLDAVESYVQRHLQL
ncbi:MAG: hypothetical protein RQ754_07205 [Desulfuromonadales bacterium]|jgi:DNA repair exonuclease SbcCD ATPase subunit|nr:hypothetical protein [Desulfuromonadales bacterium]